MSKTPKTSSVLSSILANSFDGYQKSHPVTYREQEVVRRIVYCSEERLGYHVKSCSSCCQKVYLPNSCNLAYCSKCQFVQRQEWIKKLSEEILPVDYFHMVFTVPHELNSEMLRNKKVMCSVLFKATAEAIQKLAGDRFQGGQAGFISTIHTWDQKLLPHFHIHTLIPAVFIDKDQRQHKPKINNFLFPVRLASAIFKSKFLVILKKAMRSGEFPNQNLTPLAQAIEKAEKKKWIVYSKGTGNHTKDVISYLGGYTNRVGLSNQKLKIGKDSKIAIRIKNRETKKETVQKISIDQFISRYLLHIMPKGFRRVRYHGFLSNRRKAATLKLFSIDSRPEKNDLIKPLDLFETIKKTCPYCKNLTLEFESINFKIGMRFIDPNERQLPETTRNQLPRNIKKSEAKSNSPHPINTLFTNLQIGTRSLDSS